MQWRELTWTRWALPGAAAFLVALVLLTTDYSDEVHVVQRGDTLYRIAQAHNLTYNELRLANPELKGRTLRVGQKLVIREWPLPVKIAHNVDRWCRRIGVSDPPFGDWAEEFVH